MEEHVGSSQEHTGVGMAPLWMLKGRRGSHRVKGGHRTATISYWTTKKVALRTISTNCQLRTFLTCACANENRTAMNIIKILNTLHADVKLHARVPVEQLLYKWKYRR